MHFLWLRMSKAIDLVIKTNGPFTNQGETTLLCFRFAKLIDRPVILGGGKVILAKVWPCLDLGRNEHRIAGADRGHIDSSNLDAFVDIATDLTGSRATVTDLSHNDTRSDAGNLEYG